MSVNIRMAHKAAVLVALYNHAKAVAALPTIPMTLDQASELVRQFPKLYFDYIRGRALNVNLATDTLQTRSYNARNGERAAELALLRIPGCVVR